MQELCGCVSTLPPFDADLTIDPFGTLSSNGVQMVAVSKDIRIAEVKQALPAHPGMGREDWVA